MVFVMVKLHLQEMASFRGSSAKLPPWNRFKDRMRFELVYGDLKLNTH